MDVDGDEHEIGIFLDQMTQECLSDKLTTKPRAK
jgi:hypothetical protein